MLNANYPPMLRVVHFEIHADSPERAVDFYTKVFGWKITKWEGGENYWLIETGPADQLGINGGLMKRTELKNGNSIIAYVCTMDVPSVDDYVRKVEEAGGSVEQPKGPIPGMGWLAYCKDTEGNLFGLMQSDESAK